MGLEGARLIMEAVGMIHKMDMHTLLVWLVATFIFSKLLPDFFVLVKISLCSDQGFEQDIGDGKCQCPPGFKGDGVKSCEGES